MKKALSSSVLSANVIYSGLIIVCLATLTLPAMAKGKPQKQQKAQKVEQVSGQPSSTSPNLLPTCQQQSPLSPDAGSSNLRSNKGGKLRGQARAQFVQQLNQAKKEKNQPLAGQADKVAKKEKNQRLAGQVPTACTGLPQLPSSSTTAPSTSSSTTSTTQTSTSVEVNTIK